MSRDTNPAVWLDAPGRVEIRESARPTPRAGEVLVRTRRTLISAGTELTLFAGGADLDPAWREFARFPRPLGYSLAGEVVDVGDGVDRDWVGRHVATRGQHAAWVARPADDLRPIPEGVSDEEATFATLAGVAMNGLRRAGLSWGESVAVTGLGIVGQLCVRVAATAGAGPIFAFEPSELRLGRLPRHPFVIGLLAAEGCPPLESLGRANRGRRVDFAVEASGRADLIPGEIDLLRDQGRLLLLSSPRGATSFDFHDSCNRRSISIIGAHGFSQPNVATPDNPWTSRRHGDLFLEWVADGRMTVAELVTHRFPFPRAALAYELLAGHRGEALGVILEWSETGP